jgi:hypothetical protein
MNMEEGGNGIITAAIYSGSGTLLGVSSSAPSATGWDDLTIPGGVHIVAGKQYILAGEGVTSNKDDSFQYGNVCTPVYQNSIQPESYGTFPSSITLPTSTTNPSFNMRMIYAGPVVNVTMNVKNDEDTGLFGYWALDNYTKHVTVWQTDANTYTANVTYLGTWHTFKGALSPANGLVEPDNGVGTIQGSYNAIITASSFNTMANAIGNLGTFDFGGTTSDIPLGTYSNQAGNTNPFDWVPYYFPEYTNFVQPAWSWTYTNSTYHSGGNQWINSNAGNSGDIITGPTIKVTYNVRND